MNPAAVGALANELLAAIAGIYATTGVTAPSLQYLCADEPVAWVGDNCQSALVVSWAGVNPGLPAPPMAAPALPPQQVGPGLVFHADFTVWVFRCVDVPDLTVLDPATETVLALELMTDGYLLPMAVLAAHSAGMFGLDYSTQTILGAVVPLARQGGVAGLRMPVSVVIE